jgi:hypothetical protein
MLNFIAQFAHAGEVHESPVESASHALAWYGQLAMFLVLLLVVYTVVNMVFKKKSTALLITATLLLMVGFGLYAVAPVVSATAITIGMVTTLLVTLVGLGDSSTAERKKTRHK